MCWKCGKGIAIDGPVGRTLTCAACGADVRSCKNCEFFSPGSYHDCAERVDEAVRDKERANFCDSFQLNPRYRADHAASDQARAAGTACADHAAAGKGSPSGTGLARPPDCRNSARDAFDTLFNS